ncbi:type VII secretion protein EsaA [Bacillus pseudomycoides]|nr:type VII secretion protein EsaA [Bacillus pseudomycoides]PHE05787.1 type VII secretion protein EsaA [Bacillus pseudomycoides]PHE94104.1 type VII secretion protein EsaA [Bacillus pseudomycoides]
MFIILALVFATGTSYLALNKKLKKEDEKSTPKMTVALVNEDQGTLFEGNKIAFGDQFIKNINKDNNQQWYVVSRGVAENGLKNNNYNMMIVIPNDFSRKAVSIHAEAPEKLTLSYKVNATGNKELKTEAEKTAASILEDFNRRIIDVYFASIIGKLQAAQDNIGTIVDKEQAHMKVYKTDVHNPLANYTQQFKTVQDYTGVSVNSFKGFEGVLQRFGQTIDEGAKSNATYLGGFDNLQNLQTGNNLLANNFSNQLNQFNSDLSTNDVLKQLSALESANKVIASHFNDSDKQSNALTDSTAIQQYLADVTNKMKSYDEELADKLKKNIQETINEKLKAKLSGNNTKEIYLNTLMQQPDNQINEQIKSLINKLASMDVEEIDRLTLPDETKTQLKNVVQVSKKYGEENSFHYEGSNDIPLENTIKNIKNGLATDGIIFEDKEKVAKMDGEQMFNLQLPEGFELYSSTEALMINGQDYTADYLSNGSVKLPSREEGELSVGVRVKLSDENAKIDVFTPVTWKWNLTHTHEKTPTETKPVDPPTEGQETTGENNKQSNQVVKLTNRTKTPVHSIKQLTDSKTGSETKEPNKDGNKNPGGGTTEPGGGTTNPGGGTTNPGGGTTNPGGGTTEPGGGTTNPGGGTTNPGGGTTNPGGGTTDPGGGTTNPGEGDKKVETIERTNDHIVHQKMEVLSPASSEGLIKDAVNTVKNYEELSGLYELYYGLDMKTEDLSGKLEKQALKDLATSKSLYYMLNKQNVLDIITGLVSSEIQAEVTSEMNQVKQKINDLQLLAKNVNQNSDRLAETLKQTSEQANVMNTNLAEYLNGAMKWREGSLKLMEEQRTIVSSREGEQTAILALDTGLKSLVTQSQSLAESSKGTLLASDEVYKTFDQINNQAKEIQDSGVTMVSKADTLLNDLTDKVSDDKSFAKNFSKVLANSRVGERQNEQLYKFLANPVLKQNDGVITAGNAFTPYLIVLVCFIVSLFTSYAIANQERKRHQQDDFEEKSSILDMNLPITAITFGIAIVEGVIIGIIAGKLLEFSGNQRLIWIAFITITMMAFVFVSTYLLRQAKMIGMFILLTSLSLYLFLTEAVGVKVTKTSYLGKLREFSPLQYIEDFLNNFISGKNDGHVTFAVLLVIAIVGFIINLFVWHKRWEEKIDDDETMHTAG